MANSQIESIYDAVKAWTPQYDTDVSISVRDIDELKPTLQEGDCPVRMMTVTPGDVSGEFAFIALGKTNTVQWTINDRLFLQGVNIGDGIRQYSDKLVKYVASYVGQIRDNRAPTAQSHVASASFNVDVRQWPEGSDRGFAVVDVFLTIEEVISGA